MSYSIAVSNDRYMITPFVDFDKESSDRSRLLIGSEIGALGSASANFKVEAAMGIATTYSGESDRVVGINADFRF